MTGPEHYREAERLLKSASDNFLRTGKPGSALEAAQVHATLALAAATAIPTARTQLVAEMKAWAEVAATKHSASEESAS